MAKASSVFKRQIDFDYKTAKDIWIKTEKEKILIPFNEKLSKCKPIEIIYDREDAVWENGFWNINGIYYVGYDEGEVDEYDDRFILWNTEEDMNNYNFILKEIDLAIVKFEKSISGTNDKYITQPDYKFKVSDDDLIDYL